MAYHHRSTTTITLLLPEREKDTVAIASAKEWWAISVTVKVYPCQQAPLKIYPSLVLLFLIKANLNFHNSSCFLACLTTTFIYLLQVCVLLTTGCLLVVIVIIIKSYNNKYGSEENILCVEMGWNETDWMQILIFSCCNPDSWKTITGSSRSTK